MSCKGCGSKINGVCKVCELVKEKDGDKVKIVKWCNMCGVYICDECNADLPNRWAAFLKLRLGITA